jgi:hypothetical protein
LLLLMLLLLLLFLLLLSLLSLLECTAAARSHGTPLLALSADALALARPLIGGYCGTSHALPPAHLLPNT